MNPLSQRWVAKAPLLHFFLFHALGQARVIWVGPIPPISTIYIGPAPVLDGPAGFDVFWIFADEPLLPPACPGVPDWTSGCAVDPFEEN